MQDQDPLAAEAADLPSLDSSGPPGPPPPPPMAAPAQPEDDPNHDAVNDPDKPANRAIDAMLDEAIAEQEASEGRPLTAEDQASLARVSALAQNPKLGEAVDLAGRTFRRQYLTLEAEDELIDVLQGVLAKAPGNDLVRGLLAARKQLQRAAAIVLADQWEDGGTLAHRIDLVMSWFATAPRDVGNAVSNQRLLGIVVAQIALNDTAFFLTDMLRLAVLAGRAQVGLVAPAS